ncbi:MAG: ABC transporter ATP-binding protein [Candidatus Heimdallarchaeota archaeon]|nr:ABC transporter ATP-binding protein [Candidatus Heimdallarchaeota archaeon]
MATKNLEPTIKQEIIRTRKRLAIEKYKSARQWFWSGLIRYPGLMITSSILILITALITVLPSVLLGLGIDFLATQGFGQKFIWIILAIVGLAFLIWGTTFLSSYLWGLAGYRFERDIRQEFFDVVQENSMAFHDVNDSGVLLSMGMNETNQIRFAYHPSMRHLINSILSIIMTNIYFFIRIPVGSNFIGVGKWEIGLGIALGFIIYFILAWIYATRIGPVRRELATELGNVSSATQEAFRGIEVVRSFDNEDIEDQKFAIKSSRLADRTKQEGYLSAFYWPALIMVIVTVLAFGFGLQWVSTSEMTTGQLTSALTLLLQLVILNLMIPMRLLSLQAGFINANRIWNVMNFDDPLIEAKDTIEADWSKDLIFEDVSFKYPGTERYVLTNISFRISPGSRVALIGGPGSGKSTILKLLLRLYDPTEGNISLNGYCFRDMKTFDIREDVVLVEQDIFLFGASIRDNIKFSNPDATDEEILTAARRAQILSFIESSPEGLDTIIGERGVTLSGGQKQRIAIARALLANPKLLLLDDSTSAVDIKTEARLRVAMEELIKGRTSIIVTQRLSTLVESDVIIFLDKGRMIDIGTHTELIQRCPEYQFMISLLPMGKQIIHASKKQFKAVSNGGIN